MDFFRNKCRLCIESKTIENKEFIINEEIELRVSKLIEFRIHLSNDFSDFICHECNSNLDDYWNFRHKIVEKQEKLKIFMNRFDGKSVDIKVKVEPDEVDSVIEYGVKKLGAVVIKQETQGEEILIKIRSPDKRFDERKNESGRKEIQINGFYCTKCKQKFKSEKLLESHIKITHSNEKTTFNCDQCKKKFSTSNWLNKHIQTQHHAKLLTDDKLSTASSKRRNFRPVTLHPEIMKAYIDEGKLKSPECECDICGKQFVTKQLVLDHLLLHIQSNKVQCNICLKFYKNNSCLRNHKATFHNRDPNQRFECHCGKVFGIKRFLDGHIRKVHNDEGLQNVSCEHCGKEMLSKQLQFHISYYHKKSGYFPCKYCDKIFNVRRMLHKHVVRNHERVNKLFCDYQKCGKGFPEKSLLMRHMQVNHLNSKPFICPYSGCTKSYGAPRFLKLHVGVVHEKLRETCPINDCNFGASRRDYMREHLQKHKMVKEDIKRIVDQMKLV